MSLVNDALKRASEAHSRRAPTPVADLPLRPVEPGTKPGIGLVLPATLLTIILAALISLVLARRSGGNTPNPPPVKSGLLGITVAAKSPPPLHLAPAAPVPVIAVESAPVPVMPIALAQPNSSPAPTAVVAPLRLQAVFYTPPRPSAIISGKTVQVGDSLRGLQVVAIGSSSALLQGANQTNFLTLE